ncbi:hypothetical protein BASA60_010041 [Batrachochytrium salamandrivorans]|nr:hypothetical protein BASA60_010041 [Batrachochytrium salamandrivorans]KAH9275188.1 hypothetical protein BASA83_002415 [Batrachochytrium salamandrivorans]
MDKAQCQFVQPPSASLLCPMYVYCHAITSFAVKMYTWIPLSLAGVITHFVQVVLVGALSLSDNAPSAVDGFRKKLLVLDCYQAHVRQCKFSPQKCPLHIYGCHFQGTAVGLVQHEELCVYERIKPYILTTEKRIHDLEALIQTQSMQINLLLSAKCITSSLEAKLESEATPSQPTVSTGDLQRPLSDEYNGSHTHEDPWPNGPISCKNTILSSRSGVTSLAYAMDRLYVGAYDGNIRTFDPKTGEPLHSAHAHNLSVWSLAVDSLQGKLYSSGTDGSIKVWDVHSSGKLTLDGSMEAYDGKVYSLVINGNLLVSASSDKTIRLWNRNTLECTATLTGHTAGVNAICLLPGDQLASVSSDKSIKIWDLNTGISTSTIAHLPSDALDVTFGSGMLFASTLDANITAYDINHLSRIGQMSGHRWEVWQLKYVSDVLFSGSHDHTVKRWDIRTFRSTADLIGHKIADA